MSVYNLDQYYLVTITDMIGNEPDIKHGFETIAMAKKQLKTMGIPGKAIYEVVKHGEARLHDAHIEMKLVQTKRSLWQWMKALFSRSGS